MDARAGTRRVVELPPGLADMPPGPRLALALSTVDIKQLTSGQMATVLRAQARQLAHDEALMLAYALELSRCPWEEAEGGTREQRDDYAADQVAFTINITRWGAFRMMDLAEGLLDRLPMVYEALQAGRIDRMRAKAFVEALSMLSDEKARAIAAALLDKAEHLTASQLRDRLTYRAHQADPDLARRRYRASVVDRRVWFGLDNEGTAQLGGRNLPVDRAAASKDWIDRLARAAKAEGDPRTLAQLRADAMLDLTAGIEFRIRPAHPADAYTADADADRETNPEADPGADPEADLDTNGDADREADGDTGRDTGQSAPMAAATDGLTPEEDAGQSAADTGDEAMQTVPESSARSATTTGAASPHANTSSGGGSCREVFGDEGFGGEGFGEDAGWTAEEDEAGWIGTIEPAADAGWEPEPDWEPDVHPAWTTHHQTGTDPAPTGSDHRAGEPPPPSGEPPSTSDGPPTAAGLPPTSKMCTCGVVRPGGRRGVVDIVVPLSTLLGLSQNPGLIPGWGPVVADIARQIALDQEANPAFKFSATDDAGRLLHHGHTNRRPTAVEKDFVRARDRTCRAPGCTRRAEQCDLDHRLDHAKHGPSHRGNLASLCPIHHWLKTRKHLAIHQFGPNGYLWQGPDGRLYLSPGDGDIVAIANAPDNEDDGWDLDHDAIPPRLVSQIIPT